MPPWSENFAIPCNGLLFFLFCLPLLVLSQGRFISFFFPHLSLVILSLYLILLDSFFLYSYPSKYFMCIPVCPDNLSSYSLWFSEFFFISMPLSHPRPVHFRCVGCYFYPSNISQWHFVAFQSWKDLILFFCVSLVVQLSHITTGSTHEKAYWMKTEWSIDVGEPENCSETWVHLCVHGYFLALVLCELSLKCLLSHLLQSDDTRK